MNTEGSQGASPIRLEGPLDLYSAAAASAHLRRALAGATAPVVDLGAVTGCDAAGLQLLLAACATARAGGSTLTFRAVPPAVAECAARLGLAELPLKPGNKDDLR